jgi:hypothetical protein
MHNLDELDTAFPRLTSLPLELTFKNGYVTQINTNLTLKEYKEKFLGKQVKLDYYNKDKTAEVSELIAVTVSE